MDFIDKIDSYAVGILAVIGSFYTLVRGICALTPTPKDDQLLAKSTTIYTKLLGILAKIAGIDTTQGITNNEEIK